MREGLIDLIFAGSVDLETLSRASSSTSTMLPRLTSLEERVAVADKWVKENILCSPQSIPAQFPMQINIYCPTYKLFHHRGLFFHLRSLYKLRALRNLVSSISI